MCTGRLLIVDDEPALLAVLGRYLIRLGYEVVVASGGWEACRAFETEPESFSLVLTDLSLADLPCIEMLSRMLAINRRLGLVVASGYHVDLASWPEPLRDRVIFLQKPFLPQTLAGILRDTLAAAQAFSA